MANAFAGQREAVLCCSSILTSVLVHAPVPADTVPKTLGRRVKVSTAALGELGTQKRTVVRAFERRMLGFSKQVEFLESLQWKQL